VRRCLSQKNYKNGVKLDQVSAVAAVAAGAGVVAVAGVEDYC
jgi:hypothetical protein